MLLFNIKLMFTYKSLVLVTYLMNLTKS